jgi:hypothetical protein
MDTGDAGWVDGGGGGWADGDDGAGAPPGAEAQGEQEHMERGLSKSKGVPAPFPHTWFPLVSCR